MSEVSESLIHRYQIPHPYCTCNAVMGKFIREFTERIRGGEIAIDVLKSMNIKRGCCRTKLLCLPMMDMIEEAEDVYVDETTGTVLSEEPSKPKNIITSPIF
jgi:DNA-directed RNA polymerase subunit N (RpoN/RPB10)